MNTKFSKGLQTANKNEKYSISLATRRCKLKQHWDFITPNRMAITKGTNKSKCSVRCGEEKKPLIHYYRNVNEFREHGNQNGGPHNLKLEWPPDLAILLPRIHLKDSKSVDQRYFTHLYKVCLVTATTSWNQTNNYQHIHDKENSIHKYEVCIKLWNKVKTTGTDFYFL